MAFALGTKPMSKKGSSATSQASVKEAVQNLRSFLKLVETVPQEELQRSAQTIYQEAVALAPYETGKLERSIYVRVSRDKRRGGIVAGASARSEKGYNYAGIQHENEAFHHPVKGQAHFISEPFNRETIKLVQRMRGRLKFKK